jgi:hypothetical protein
MKPQPTRRTDPAHRAEHGGPAMLQSRLATYTLVNFFFCLSYWPAFYLTWGRDPRFGPRTALAT